ncbi:hypothetical protein C8R44DRAFT_814011 [Mycena epipterygia]|nr:hypothetical protein C8R44DRAFT_814011 [Mycena epipterygia]
MRRRWVRPPIPLAPQASSPHPAPLPLSRACACTGLRTRATQLHAWMKVGVRAAYRRNQSSHVRRMRRGPSVRVHGLVGRRARAGDGGKEALGGAGTPASGARRPRSAGRVTPGGTACKRALRRMRARAAPVRVHTDVQWPWIRAGVRVAYRRSRSSRARRTRRGPSMHVHGPVGRQVRAVDGGKETSDGAGTPVSGARASGGRRPRAASRVTPGAAACKRSSARHAHACAAPARGAWQHPGTDVRCPLCLHPASISTSFPPIIASARPLVPIRIYTFTPAPITMRGNISIPAPSSSPRPPPPRAHTRRADARPGAPARADSFGAGPAGPPTDILATAVAVEASRTGDSRIIAPALRLSRASTVNAG